MNAFLSESLRNAERLQSTWNLAREEIKNRQRNLDLIDDRIKNLEEEKESEEKRRRSLRALNERVALEAAFREYDQARRKEALGALLGLEVQDPDFTQKAPKLAVKYLSNLCFQQDNKGFGKMTRGYTESILKLNLPQKIRAACDITSLLHSFSSPLEDKSSLPSPSRPDFNITQIEAALYKLLDDEHAEKLMFLVHEFARNSKKNRNSSSDEKSEHKKVLTEIQENIKKRYKPGGLHRVFDQQGAFLKEQSSLADSIEIILEKYSEKNGKIKSKKTAVLSHIHALISEVRSRNISKTFGLWRDPLDAKTIGQIVRLVSAIQKFLMEKNLRNKSKLKEFYDVIVGSIEDSLKKTLLPYLKMEIFELLDDPLTILEYLKEVLIHFIKSQNGKFDSPLHANFRRWLNIHFYDNPGSPSTPTLENKAKEKASYFLELYKHLIKEGIDERRKFNVLKLLKIFSQNQNNPPGLESAVRSSFPKLLKEKSPIPEILHPKCTDVESALECLALEPESERQSILRDALTIRSAAAELFVPAPVPELLPRCSQFQKLYEQRKADIPFSPKETKESKESVERESQLEDLRAGRETLFSNIQLNRDVLKKTERGLLTLIRYQTLAAVFHYYAAEKSWLFHRENGLSQAKGLLKNLSQTDLSLEEGLEELITFLRNRPNLRDQSFATFLLAQMFSEHGGVLQAPLDSGIQGGIEKLRVFSESCLEQYREQGQLIQNLLIQNGFSLEALPADNNCLKDLALQYKRVHTLEASSPRYRRSRLFGQPQILQSNTWKNGPSGRWKSFFFKKVDNVRCEAEEKALEILDQVKSSISARENNF